MENNQNKIRNYKAKIIKASINEETELVELAIMNDWFASRNLDLTIENLNLYIKDITGCANLKEYYNETQE